MRVRDIMTKNVLTIPEETSVEDAARIMRDGKIGLLPIGGLHKVSGVISDRDMSTRTTKEKLAGYALSKVATVA